jgi:hypothetical protein
MPSLENLRKQAKLILRWHRERYYPVAAQIRAVLPRFAHLSDPEILAHEFKLSDAQEMVARQAGFDSWQALKSGIATMLSLQPAPRQGRPSAKRPRSCSSPTSRRRATSSSRSSASRSCSSTASRRSTPK